jgi:hypothetical protein
VVIVVGNKNASNPFCLFSNPSSVTVVTELVCECVVTSTWLDVLFDFIVGKRDKNITTKWQTDLISIGRLTS